jgi:hypothetical protein
MKDLKEIECQEIYGGGGVFKWFGKVYAHFLNSVDKQIEYTYQKVMVEGQILAD